MRRTSITQLVQCQCSISRPRRLEAASEKTFEQGCGLLYWQLSNLLKR